LERIVLAYSGGLNASAAISWLAETRRAEVISLTLDLGQGGNLEPVRERALAAGATRAHVLDVREEFALRYVLPALQAGACDDGGWPLAAALGQPLIAKTLLDIARIEGAASVAHACPGNSRDGARIDAAVRALAPDARVVAPAREWGMSRAQTAEYARDRGVPLPDGAEGPCVVDANLWGRSVLCRVPGDDPSGEPLADVYALTRDPSRCPAEPACAA